MPPAENKNILVIFSTGALAHAIVAPYRYLQDYSSPQGLQWQIIPFVNGTLSVAGTNEDDKN